jgi:RNA polymerase sigma-70 factor (family 1)
MQKKGNDILKQFETDRNSAFRKMFDCYYAPLCAAANFYIRDQNEAEDIVQQVFIHIWEKGNLNRIETSLQSYLFVSVRNASLNSIKRKQHQHLDTDLAFIDETAMQTLEIMLDQEKCNIILQALNALSDQTRKVFELVYFENLTYKQAAEKLDISVNTIKYHLKSALLILKNNTLIQNYFFEKKS